MHRGSDVSDVRCHDLTLTYTYIHPGYLCSASFSRSAVDSNKFPILSSRSLITEYQFLIPIIFRSSSTSLVHLLHGLPLFLIPSILLVIFFFALFRYTSFPYVHTILIWLLLHILHCVPLVMFPVCPYLFLGSKMLFSFMGLYIFITICLSNTPALRTFIAFDFDSLLRIIEQWSNIIEMRSPFIHSIKFALSHTCFDTVYTVGTVMSQSTVCVSVAVSTFPVMVKARCGHEQINLVKANNVVRGHDRTVIESWADREWTVDARIVEIGP